MENSKPKLGPKLALGCLNPKNLNPNVTNQIWCLALCARHTLNLALTLILTLTLIIVAMNLIKS